MKTLRTGFALALPALALSLAACGKSHDVANNQAEIAGDNVTVNDEDALAGNLDDATFANASDANAADANAIAPIGNAQQQARGRRPVSRSPRNAPQAQLGPGLA